MYIEEEAYMTSVCLSYGIYIFILLCIQKKRLVFSSWITWE